MSRRVRSSDVPVEFPLRVKLLTFVISLTAGLVISFLGGALFDHFLIQSGRLPGLLEIAGGNPATLLVGLLGLAAVAGCFIYSGIISALTVSTNRFH